MNKITKHSTSLQIIDTEQEKLIFSNVSEIIESRKFNAISLANSQVVLMFWEIGKYINSAILGMERRIWQKDCRYTVTTIGCEIWQVVKCKNKLKELLDE